MGYEVKKQSYGRGWKVLVTAYINGKQRARALRPEEFRSQFGGIQTIEDARAVAAKLNAQSELKTYEERKQRIHERLKEEDLTLLAHLPSRLIEEFESGPLYGDAVPESKDKVDITWRSCKKCLAALKIDPSEWEESRAKFYAYFTKKAYALSTVQKMLRYLNRWGKWLSRKEGKFFAPIPAPKHIARQQIASANRAKPRKSGNKVSLPLSFSELEAKRTRLTEKEFNWLYCSVAFGLRPDEVDELRGEEPYEISEQNGIRVLSIYQWKLKLTDHDRRRKYIPAILPEQERALALIEEGCLERPSSARIKGIFGRGYTHYAGRNNFVPMMFGHERPLEEVSPWMGHKNIKTTWGYYQKLLSRQAVIKKST